MVIALAFLATAVASLFAQATLVRYTASRRPHQLAWTIALAMFALAVGGAGHRDLDRLGPRAPSASSTCSARS